MADFSVAVLKICILGGSSELQSKWIQSYAKMYSQLKNPFGYDILTKQFEVDNQKIKLLIMDLSLDVYSPPNRGVLAGSSATFVTYDKSDRNSFNRIKEWWAEQHTVATYEPKEITAWGEVHSVLVPTTKTIDPSGLITAIIGLITESEVITTEEGLSFAEEVGAVFYEISPSDTKLITNILKDVVRDRFHSKESD